MRFGVLILVSICSYFASANAGEPPALKAGVVSNMKEVHSGFEGQRGYVAQFGDSITYSMAFWSVLSWADPSEYLSENDGLPKTPRNQLWKNYIEGARDKGPEFGNYSGWKVGDLLKSMDGVLARKKPVAALLMIGTNDIKGGNVPDNYKADLDTVISKCIAAHCIPILNTIPPRRDREQAVNEINAIIRELAASKQIPLADFHAECLKRQPGNAWDGTLISKDGVHPSGGKTNDYSEANLRKSGYALRNWVNFQVFRQVYFEVIAPQ